jgi:hypothetical protein
MIKKISTMLLLCATVSLAPVVQAAEVSSDINLRPIVSTARGLGYLLGTNEDERKLFFGYLYGALGMGNHVFFCLPETPSIKSMGLFAVRAFNSIPEDKRDVVEAADALAVYLALRYKCTKA